jgi:hypothetical protein
MESEPDKFPVIPRPVELLRDVPYLHEDLLHIISPTMESEANNKALTTIIPSPDELTTSILDLPVEMLRHIATFLDFRSLLQFRLVSAEWNAAGIRILMKRGYYDLTCPCYDYERPDCYRGAMKYSSWKITHSVYDSSKLLHDNGMWQNVSSLSIHEPIPLRREFHSWAWETIQSRCPNLQEISFTFERSFNTEPESRVKSDYETAIQGLPNASFPKISYLRNLTSVTFKGICDKTTAYFAETLLQACANLRKLSFCPLRRPKILDLESFRIFVYLQNNSSLLKNLQSFAFTVGIYRADENEQESRFFSYHLEQSEFTRLLAPNSSSSLLFQFSEKLQSLFWDSPFRLDDQLLPGVLTPSVSSSLLQLCLTGYIEQLGKIADEDSPCPIKLSFPNFLRLRALKLGLQTAYSLSVPELVDSAPNLYVLEMKGMKELVSGRRTLLGSSLWRRTDRVDSVSHSKQHLQLRIFCTDIPCTNVKTLGEILGKFPNLLEIRLGRFDGVGLDAFLSFVQSTHIKLQILSWNSSDKFTLEQLLNHLIRVQAQLPSLHSYSLGWQGRYSGDCEDVTWPDSIQDMEESANILLSLPSKSDSALVINLLFKSLSCGCVSKEESAANDCKKCYLHNFIRKRNLPIRIHTVKQIEEMERRYEWNHRFASTWIYK